MWKEENNRLSKEFNFKNFSEAWGFMSQVALLAEQQNHHPEWLNIYNHVKIILSTHDAGNIITEKDRQLARAIDTITER